MGVSGPGEADEGRHSGRQVRGPSDKRVIPARSQREAALPAPGGRMSTTCSDLESSLDCPQPASRYPREGLLKYNREADIQALNPLTVLPATQLAADLQVKCEFCGQTANPPLDLTSDCPPVVTIFCCTQHQNLYETLLSQKCLYKAESEFGPEEMMSLDMGATMELEELLYPGRKQDHEKLQGEAPKVFRFRLSCPQRKGVSITDEECSRPKEDDQPALAPVCGHKPLHFGLCYQDGTGFQQKYYSSGMPFLTLFPDGSAQVFYPSGLLALIVVVTELKGRVCLVYDDSQGAEQPLRALFQSDGRATCYHTNGNIALSLERPGGQCLDETGARLRRWLWSSLEFTSAPLRPIFLSLNQIVGVRVLDEDEVFVSILANGQQAKFSMGACCVQVQREKEEIVSKPLVLKDELFLLAARIRVHLAIQQLHYRLTTHNIPLPPKVSTTARLHSVVQRLLKVSNDIELSIRERDFIHGCLKYVTT